MRVAAMACWWGRSTLEMDDRGLRSTKKTHRYRGATTVAAIDAPHSRPGDSILRVPKGWLPDCGFGDDAPRVRRPTCRCVYGRPPLLASAADQDEDETDDGLCAPPPPQRSAWKSTRRAS